MTHILMMVQTVPKIYWMFLRRDVMKNNNNNTLNYKNPFLVF